jgi:hypothetical protein
VATTGDEIQSERDPWLSADSALWSKTPEHLNPSSDLGNGKCELNPFISPHGSGKNARVKVPGQSTAFAQYFCLGQIFPR